MITVHGPMPRRQVPDIYCPFPQRTSPYVGLTRGHLDIWSRRTGLVHRASAIRRFEQADFGAFVGMVYPTASREHLDPGSPGQVREVVARMRSVVDGTVPVQPPGEEPPAAVVALADLWGRTVPLAARHWRTRFARHLVTYLTTATAWETPKRRHTGAIHVCMDLIEIVAEAPESIHNDPRFITALEASCNVVCWANDAYSYEKEQVLGEIHNLVHLVRHHRGLGKEQALGHVCARIADETERFLVAKDELLEMYPQLSPMLVPYPDGMRS